MKQVKDYSISQEEFQLIYHADLDLYQTQFNKFESLDRYYESENYISHTDSKKSWFDKMYQMVKTFTIKSKWRLIKKYIQNKNITILDVGCGTGDFLKAGKKNGFNVVGAEPNKNARALAEKKSLTVKSDLSEINNIQFDVITLWHVLEHVPDYNDYINQLKKILKPNGILIIAVPNFNSYDAHHYKNYWAAWDVPRHLWHFSKKTFFKVSEKHQLKLIHIKPMYFDSFYVSLLSEKYKSGTKKLFKGFLIGLWSNFIGMWSKEYSSHIYILKK